MFAESIGTLRQGFTQTHFYRLIRLRSDLSVLLRDGDVSGDLRRQRGRLDDARPLRTHAYQPLRPPQLRPSRLRRRRHQDGGRTLFRTTSVRDTHSGRGVRQEQTMSRRPEAVLRSRISMRQR